MVTLNLPAQVNTALELLAHGGFEAYVVGGAVRDSVMGLAAKDWDVTTNALPKQIEEVFRGFRSIETGLKHGTVTVIVDGMPLEITTYRIDGEYSDRRRPDAVTFTGSLSDDLQRRDFTVNALAYNHRDGLVDLHGGIADIKARLIRCVGDPDSRFCEDGLRILRALRFASVFEMRIEAGTSAAIHRNKDLLHDIAAERIFVELTKLLCGRGAAEILGEFADVIAVPIPELSATFGFEQHNPHHDKDVWQHTLAVLRNTPPQPALRWAALLHDAGKPACFFTDDDGIGHFYGHGKISTDLARTILTRLRIDNDGKRRILTLIEYHDAPITCTSKALKRLLNKVGAEALFQLLALHRADALGQAPRSLERLPVYDEAERLVNSLIEENTCFSLRDLAVDGRDMLQLGFTGAEIGEALSKCLDAVLDDELPNEKSALLDFVKGKQNRDEI